MPKHKSFINRKEAVTFALVQRSQQDKLAGDASAPQHVLKDISRKREQQKYGVYFDDDYDYLQHMRHRYNGQSEAGDESSMADLDYASTANLNSGEGLNKDIEDGDDVVVFHDDEVHEKADTPSGAPGLVFHEDLLGYDEPLYDGRVIENEEELDPDLLEAMRRAENEADDNDEEGDEFPDDFVQMASCADPEYEDEADQYEPSSANKRALLDHFFDSLGGDSARGLATFGEEEEEEEEEEEGESKILKQLRSGRLKAEEEGRDADYHSQCLSLQIENLVGNAVTYDIEAVRSRISGMSFAVSESVQQALETDKRMAEQSVVYNTEETMTPDERKEHIARTLAIVHENEDEDDDDEEDPVQAWVDFDRRPCVTDTVDTPRANDLPLADVVGSCVIHPGTIKLPQKTSCSTPQRKEEMKEEECADMEEEESCQSTIPVRDKNESKEERKNRKAAVKAHQRERRALKKENKLSFKAETARYKSMTAGGNASGGAVTSMNF